MLKQKEHMVDLSIKFPLEAFMERLRRAGFMVSTEQFIDVQILVNTLIPEHDYAALKSLLCPIFARDEEEQQRFYRLFEEFFQVATLSKPKVDLEKNKKTSSTLKTQESKQEKTKKNKKQNRKLYGFWGLVILGWIIIILRAASSFSNLLIFGALVFLILGLVYFVWTNFSRQKSVEKFKSNLVPPLRFFPNVTLPNFDLLTKTETFRVQRTLSFQEFDDYNTNAIDFDSTLERTIANAGVIDIAYERIVSRPSYLLLIDEASNNRHQIQWFEYLLRLLEGDGLRTERYFYHYDPSQVWQEHPEESVALPTIFAGQRLLILGEAQTFANATYGGINDWVLDLFSLWKEKAIITPKPVEDWGYEEVELTGEFVIVPATIEGLMDSVGQFDELSAKTFNDWKLENKFDVVHTENIELIQSALSPAVFDWLCACAIYPDLYWKLTLHLGDLLETYHGELLNKQQITLLSEILWFREGSMPDEIRKALISLLPKSKETIVRKTIITLLKKEASIPPKGTYAYRDWQLNLWWNQFEVAEDEWEKRRYFFNMQAMRVGQGCTDRCLITLLENEDLRLQYGYDFSAGLHQSFTEKENRTQRILKFYVNDGLTNIRYLFGNDEAKLLVPKLTWLLLNGDKIELHEERIQDKVFASRKVLLIAANPMYFDFEKLIHRILPAYQEGIFDTILVFRYNQIAPSVKVQAEGLQKALRAVGFTEKAKKLPTLTILGVQHFGILGRYYLEQLNGQQYVEHLIMVDTQNLGLVDSSWNKWFFRIYKSIILLKGLPDLSEGSRLLKALNQPKPRAIKVKYSLLILRELQKTVRELFPRPPEKTSNDSSQKGEIKFNNELAFAKEFFVENQPRPTIETGVYLPEKLYDRADNWEKVLTFLRWQKEDDFTEIEAEIQAEDIREEALNLDELEVEELDVPINQPFQQQQQQQIFQETIPEVEINEQEKVEDLLPIILYFENDQPDDNNNRREPSTSMTYEECFSQYYRAKDTYYKEAQSLPPEEIEQAMTEIDDFFDNSLQIGLEKLAQLSDRLLKDLKSGYTIEIIMEGYASPLGQSDYNKNLVQRRINSIDNYFRNYRDSELDFYLNMGLFVINDYTKEPKPNTKISNSIIGQRSSIYSVEAAKERRVEIVEIIRNEQTLKRKA